MTNTTIRPATPVSDHPRLSVITPTTVFRS